MFSTSTKSLINNGNPFPTASFLGQDNGDYIFSHQDLTTAAHFFPAAAINNAPPPVLRNTNNGKKPAAHSKKDNHSKIVTAHGPRDRRVRLSIQIAREFFDLQDTLGFDRASKTLEWLLTKSKSSIEELVNTKHSSRGKNISETSEIGEKSKRKPLMTSMKHQKDSNFPLLARELRAKARERARERTKKKMFIRFLNESEKLVPDFRSPVQNYQRSLINSKQVSLYYSHGIGNWDISNSFPQASPSTADFQNCGKQLWGGVKLPDYE